MLLDKVHVSKRELQMASAVYSLSLVLDEQDDHESNDTVSEKASDDETSNTSSPEQIKADDIDDAIVHEVIIPARFTHEDKSLGGGFS